MTTKFDVSERVYVEAKIVKICATDSLTDSVLYTVLNKDGTLSQYTEDGLVKIAAAANDPDPTGEEPQTGEVDTPTPPKGEDDF